MTTIPDCAPNCDIWVDFETHQWMDTVALRPLTNRGNLYLHDICLGDECYRGELRLSRQQFDEWFYDLAQKDAIHLSVKANT